MYYVFEFAKRVDLKCSNHTHTHTHTHTQRSESLWYTVEIHTTLQINCISIKQKKFYSVYCFKLLSLGII